MMPWRTISYWSACQPFWRWIVRKIAFILTKSNAIRAKPLSHMASCIHIEDPTLSEGAMMSRSIWVRIFSSSIKTWVQLHLCLQLQLFEAQKQKSQWGLLTTSLVPGSVSNPISDVYLSPLSMAAHADTHIPWMYIMHIHNTQEYGENRCKYAVK